ncbi:MAG TPA: isocitrate lyase/phosphoenolpyruvate mutase family protein [Solirubrobacteraceae bacterium]
MSDQQQKAVRFLELHRAGQPLLMPNAWDAGSAKVLEHLGFEAIATTSSGFAATLGRLDGSVTREEVLAHSAALVAATDIPVSADLENGFGAIPGEVAETARGARDAGLAGFSIEDYSQNADDPIYPLELAADRIAAAARIAHEGPAKLVLTARAENHLRGRQDLDDTIARLKAYQEAGADVLFAPGLRDAEEISRVVDAVELPVSVLAGPGSPPVSELAGLGVARVSVGGGFAFAALGELVEAATELREQGTYGYRAPMRDGFHAAREAFGS